MNVNNQLGSRPGIRLFPGHSAGGSFSGNSGIIGGGGDDAFQSKTHSGKNEASRILKQLQAEKHQSSYDKAQCAAPEPPMSREPVGESLRRRTVIDASHQQQENFMHHYEPKVEPRSQPEPACSYEQAAPVASYERQVPARAAAPSSYPQGTSTSLCFGEQSSQQSSRNTRRVHNKGDAGVPEWMGGGGARQQKEAPAPQRRQVIDCSPPGSREGSIPGLPGRQVAGRGSSNQPAGSRSRQAEGISFGYDASMKELAGDVKSRMQLDSEARLKQRPF